MKYRLFFIALIAALGVTLGGTAMAQESNDQAEQAPPTAADAKAFVERINQELYERLPLLSSAFWLQSTYINEDSQAVASYFNEQYLGWMSEVVREASTYSGLDLAPDVARMIKIIETGQTVPAPQDSALRAELAKILSAMEAMYGSGKYCPEGKPENEENCRNLSELEDVIDHSRDYDALKAAWVQWRTVSIPMKDDYARFVELVNKGAQGLGYDNVGILWRSGYDMPPDEFTQTLEGLWQEVKPLYHELQCHVRAELEDHYGSDHFGEDNLIPAHLLGNMWSQEWANIYPLMEPYPDVKQLDLTAALKAQDYTPMEMVESAEGFYQSLGMGELPDSFWEKSLFVKPEDRDVVCHASAWDLDMKGDVRIKMCIDVNDQDLETIYHELGHLYYDLAYNPLPPLFQAGAHDGFHEAIGDAVVLSMTPEYFQQIGLVEDAADSQEAVINRQMKSALNKIAFLPFGLMIDQWRWQVFSGEITPDEYNSAWWQLREKYQGIKAPVPRTDAQFDPGAKYHIPANTPYTRYFLARILQFQFHRAMCEIAGIEGPLYACSMYGNEEAGARFEAMMSKGAGQPWQNTLAELTGTREMDASAIIDYYQPLMGWLKEQNQGRDCGWTASGVSIAR